MIAATILAAHWFFWPPSPQIGIAVGHGVDEHLMMMMPEGKCSEGIHVYGGRYGESDRALALLKKSKICSRSTKTVARF